MKPTLIAAAEIDRIDTWAKYSSHMCGGCISSCCTLPVEVKIKDLIRIGIVDEFERGEPAKNIAKRLQKEGIVERYNQKSEIFTLQRMSNNDCLYLDRKKPGLCHPFTKSAPTPAATTRKSGRDLGTAHMCRKRLSASRPTTLSIFSDTSDRSSRSAIPTQSVRNDQTQS